MKTRWAVTMVCVLLAAGCGAPNAVATPTQLANATATSEIIATPGNESATQTPTSVPATASVVPTATPAATASSIPTATALATEPAPTQTLDLPQTYTNAIIGYSFNYPSGWNVTDFGVEDGKTIYLFSYDPASVPQGKNNGIPEGETKIDFSAPLPEKFASLDDFTTYIKQSIANSGDDTTVLAEERITLPSGWEATYLKTQTSFGIGEAYHLVVNGNGLIVGSGSAESGTLRNIVETLRPTQ